MHYTTSTKISTLTHGISRSASLAMSEKLFAIDHQSRPLVLCVLTVVVGQLAREPDVQDAKGPVCACVGGDDGQGPVSDQAVDLDGALASTPAISRVVGHIRLLASTFWWVQDQRESEGVPFVVTGTCVDCSIGGCRHGKCNDTSARCECDYG